MNRLRRHILPIEADPIIWDLLDRYLFLINDKLKKRDWPLINQRRLIGTIVTYFLLENKEHILASYDRAQYEKLKAELGEFFSEGELAQIGIPKTIKESIVL